MKCPLGPHVLACMAWMPPFLAGPVWAGSPPRWPGTQPSIELSPSVLLGVLGLRFLQQSSSDWHWERIHFAHRNAFPGTHSAPPLLIINMYLMSLFSELQWLFPPAPPPPPSGKWKTIRLVVSLWFISRVISQNQQVTFPRKSSRVYSRRYMRTLVILLLKKICALSMCQV